MKVRKMELNDKWNSGSISMGLINLAYIMALCVVVFPLLLIAQYNYPCADDWSFGVNGYNAIASGEGILGVVKAAFLTMRENYFKWEGRFAAVLCASFMPGIWGEQYYAVVPWLMIGIVIVSEVYLAWNLLNSTTKANRWLVVPIIVPALILQILYTPFPEEVFYWYTGSVNYTFMFGLSLILIVLFLKMAVKECSRLKYVVWAVGAGLLAILIGGNNFATSLSVFLFFFLLDVLFAVWNKRALYRTWFITLLTGGSLLACIFAPGNTNRLNSNFGGETEGAIEAVIMSLARSATNIYSWTNIKVILLLLLIIPFMWKAVKNMDFSFKYPGLVTLFSFGLYASQIAATMYVDGNTGGGRMAGILFFSYYVWLVGNVCYWLGWLDKRGIKKVDGSTQKQQSGYILVYCGILGILLVGAIYTSDLQEVTSYKAYRNWRQGLAQQYAAEWDARLEILHDENITEIVFHPLTVRPEMLLYADLQEDDGHVWVNTACATYYGKTSIRVVKEE